MGQRLIVRNNQAPGDIIVLSAALRDLERAHPGRYATEVVVSRGAEHIFWNNPDVVSADLSNAKVDSRDAVVFRAEYPLIKSCNQQRKHFILGFIEHMNATLGTQVKLTEFRPHIVMSAAEQATRPFDVPYWVFLSGGKKDYPAKIWAQTYWQEVITATRDRVNWVQCGGGSSNHIMHTPKDGIYANMVAKTDCRNFLRLIYHAEGVVCVTTMAMHAAAAFNKPCIVIEGGREPWWWEAYDEKTRLMNMRLFHPDWKPPADDDFVPHRYLHTIGKLACCSNHGCWRRRVTGGESVCTFPVTIGGQTLSKCKSMITPAMVISALDGYLEEGRARRASAANAVKVPLLSMRSPDNDQRPVESLPPVSRPARIQSTTPAVDVGELRICVYGKNVPIAMAGPKVFVSDSGVSRASVLHSLMVHGDEWLVWVEHGAKLHPSWLDRLTPLLGEPALVGRAHRTRGRTLYPYPAFFAVHRTLVVPSDSFAESFSIRPEQVRDVRQIATLSSEHREP